MAEEEHQDTSQKTEDPTQRRLEDAVKSGDVPFSREVTTFVTFLVTSIFVIWVLPNIAKKACYMMSSYFQNLAGISLSSEPEVIKVFMVLFLKGIAIGPLGLCFFASIAGSIVQNGFLFAPDALKFDVKRISPITGLKRLFSLKSLIEFIKGILKLILVGTLLYYIIKPSLNMLSQDFTLGVFITLLAHLITRMLIALVIILGFIAILDYYYQKYEYTKKLRMSLKDIQEELKQSEGDPEVKARLKRIRKERVANIIKKAVPQATVVISNPTHYAIALLYDEDTMPAPKVVAKGLDFLAQTIKELAIRHRVPVVRNPPLAKALYRSADVNSYIPEAHYRAVALVLAELAKVQNTI